MRVFKTISRVLFIISIILCIYWYDWKLLVILFIWSWAMNADNRAKRIREIENKLYGK